MNMYKVGDRVYYYIWDRGGRAKFESMIPIHGKYIQEYIDLVLPKTDSVY